MNTPPVAAADSSPRRKGRIFTFYSYKGGTGRSMALANVAWILAMHGKRVLVIDWDFEAPGLHRYYWPFLPDPELTETPGLIDFFLHFGEAARLQTRHPTNTDEPKESWFQERANLTGYSTPLDYEFPGEGVLDFVGAGQQGPTYGVRVNTFQWGDFYQRLGGGVFLEAVKARLREDYDFVLIDSRTGLSDTSGICTVQMPDELVVCFTLNRQSIHGASATATSADIQRRRADGTQGLKIWPVPTRVELHEKDRLEAARLVAREKFAPFLWHIPAADRLEYWGTSEVLYFPFYAYEEMLATIADAPQNNVSLLSSMERLTARLTEGEIRQMPSLTRTARAALRARYDSAQTSPKAADAGRLRFYISHARVDGSEDFIAKLTSQINARFGANSVFWDQLMAPGEEWEPRLQKELAVADTVIVVAGEAWGRTDWTRRELDWALEQGKSLVPVLLPGMSSRRLPEELEGRRSFSLEKADAAAATQFVEELSDFDLTCTEPPLLVVNVDDPQKGQWGGASEAGGRQLTAAITDQDNGWFLVDLTVAHIDGPPLTGEVEFHLHPSFHPAIIRAPVHNGHATLKFPAWGAFTVGVSADDGRTRLELDLAQLSEAPALFRER
jgi:hypothetical protein